MAIAHLLAQGGGVIVSISPAAAELVPVSVQMSLSVQQRTLGTAAWATRPRRRCSARWA